MKTLATLMIAAPTFVLAHGAHAHVDAGHSHIVELAVLGLIGLAAWRLAR